MAYADLIFYIDCYQGNVIPDDVFSRYAQRASEIIDALTHNRISRFSMTDDVSSKIKKANCEIAEKLYRDELIDDSTKGGNISSIKAGNETITYNANAIDSLSYKMKYMECFTIVSKYLGCTGLLYGGIK